MKYELTYIISAVVPETEHAAIHQDIVDALKLVKANIVKQPYVLGRRKLAYPIKKQKQGFYASLEFEAEEKDGLKELDTRLRHHDKLLRHLIIKREAEKKYGKPKVLKYTDKPEVKTRPMSRRDSSRSSRPAPARKVESKPAEKVSTEDIDKKLDEILSKEPKID